MSAAEKIELKIEPLDPSRLSQAEFARVVHVVNIPTDYPYEALFTPDAWKRIARADKLRLGDEIVVRSDDLTLWAKLLVIESVSVHANVKVRELIAPVKGAGITQDEGPDDKYEIRHLGVQDQWAVVHKPDGRTIVKNMKSRDACKDYINNLRPQPVGGRR